MDDQSAKLELLQTKILEIEALRKGYNKVKLVQWQTEVKMILESSIGDQSKYFQQFTDIDYRPHFWNEENRQQQQYDAYAKGLDEAQGLLKAVIYGIQKGLV